jgi:hypothetical protein
MAQSVDEILAEVLNLQSEYELSIIKLSEPISRGNGHVDKSRTSDASTDAFENPTPASLEADLTHYKVFRHISQEYYN